MGYVQDSRNSHISVCFGAPVLRMLNDDQLLPCIAAQPQCWTAKHAAEHCCVQHANAAVFAYFQPHLLCNFSPSELHCRAAPPHTLPPAAAAAAAAASDAHINFVHRWWSYNARSGEEKGIMHHSLSKVAGEALGCCDQLE
jgi:hypothetical protein